MNVGLKKNFQKKLKLPGLPRVETEYLGFDLISIGIRSLSHRTLGLGSPSTRQVTCAVRPCSTDFRAGWASINGKPSGS